MSHHVSLIDQMNSKFGIKSVVHFTDGHGGLPKVLIQHESGSSVECYLYGAHITSWKDCRKQELLFVSNKSFYGHGKPIRGGIPVIFPQFGPNGPLPHHGFARTNTWQVVSTKVDDHKNVIIELSLSQNEETLKLWPHHFTLKFGITLSDTICHNELTVENNNPDQPFSFTTALHTYYRVNIHKTSLHGLQNLEYIDKTDNMQVKKETAVDKEITAETDAVYVDAPEWFIIQDVVQENNKVERKDHIVIQKLGFKDVVVWNPWIEKAKKIPDFDEHEYLNMVCVEAAVVKNPIELKPGEKWNGHVIMSAIHH